MIKHEYDSEVLQLSTEEAGIVTMGLVPDDLLASINKRIQEVINKRGQNGWEVLYPFSVPTLWFKRIATTKKKRIAG
jgi:hypothetical protein